MDSARARVARVDDSGDVQTLQVEFHGEVKPDVPHALPYGLAVGLPKKSIGLLTRVGAAADNLVAWAMNFARHRPRDLSEGDVTLYSGHSSRVDLRDHGVDVKGNTDVDGTVNADGYKTCGIAGKSGTLTLTDTQSASVWVLTFKGGLLTNVSATPPTSWVEG